MAWLFSKAMMDACAPSNCLPVQAAEFSEGNYSDGEPYAQLNVMPTPHKFWRNDKTMEFSDLSRFGLTLRLLTEDHGETLLMSYLAAFPVRISAQQEKAQVSGGGRSGLWSQMRRIISEVQPKYIRVENSPILTGRGLGVVLGDLASLGFNARWGVISGQDVGASHLRERIWILASHPDRQRLEGRQQWPKQRFFTLDYMAASQCFPRSLYDLPQPLVFGSGNGIPFRMDRTRAIGNSQIPRVAAAAWRILSQ